MTKQLSLKRAELQAAEYIRLNSVIQLNNDFENSLIPKKKINYDLRIYKDSNNVLFYPYVFSKTLEHDINTGFVKKDDLDKLFTSLEDGTVESINNIILSTSTQRKLENLLASSSYNLVGTDSVAFSIPNFNNVDSEAGAFEMAEVYGKAISRDIPFGDYNTNPTVNNVINSLNEYSDFTTAPLDNGSITSNLLFRGAGTDEQYGPYISQLLYLDFNYGNLTMKQKYQSESDYISSLDKTEWLEIQNGKVNGSVLKTDEKYIYNGRILGSAVHNDPLYQFYYNAALILKQNGINPSAFTLSNSSAWTSGGMPNILASVAHVCQGALRSAWNAKWNLGMKIRPEVYAQRLNLSDENLVDSNQVPGLNSMYSLLRNSIKSLVKNFNNTISGGTNNNLLLLLQYPEGSPTHPSHPAGHAVVAGAATTILKAMFNCHEEDEITRKAWPNQAVHSIDGDNLVDYNGTDAGNMTIVGELNKLASNVALGRDFSGVHYRCDGDCGIKLGEDFAITYLVDIAKELHESQNGSFDSWLLEKFNGDIIKIKSIGVSTI